MNDYNTLQIESYLEGDMTEEEKKRFESQLSSDDELRAFVETYRTINTEMRNAQKFEAQEMELKNTLRGLNKVYFSLQTPLQATAPVVAINKSRGFSKIALSAAAAVVLIFVSYLFFANNNNAKSLADDYVKTELSHLSQTMDGAKDSLQQGIAAYNKNDFNKAIELFESVYKSHPDNSDALRYAGTTYLVTKQYDKALEYFDVLADKQLFSNHGLFLKAITLLQRNQPGDEEQARQLLEKVVAEKTEGAKEAELWLKQWR